jgi:hypothetical protein
LEAARFTIKGIKHITLGPPTPLFYRIWKNLPFCAVPGRLFLRIYNCSGCSENRVENRSPIERRLMKNQAWGPIMKLLRLWQCRQFSGESRIARRPRRALKRQVHLRAERLEEREVPSGSTFAVTSTSDGGAGSLRQAILDANAASSAAAIIFNIPGSGVQTIRPSTPLPIISVPVTLDGTTQPGFSGTPLIQLDGSQAIGQAPSGLTLFGGNSTVQGLVINRFGGFGITLAQKGGDVIQGNYIGTDATGRPALGNYGGIVVACNRNRIGTNGDGVNDAAERNLISGNLGGGGGVDIGSNGNVVAGNYIGTDVTGTRALANSFGIALGGTANLVGTTGNDVDDAAERNLISGNQYDGVAIPNGDHNAIAGNYIGTDITGSLALGNGLASVDLYQGAHANRIGTSGTSKNPADERNLLSGNALFGVDIRDAGTTQNLVAGNYIGTDVTGSKPLGNLNYGVYLEPGSGYNIIGGTAFGAGNLISANGSSTYPGDGVYLSSSNSNLVQGNLIGTDASGENGSGNAGYGVAILNSSFNLIGGVTAGENLISANHLDGILVFGAGSAGNVIEGNFIGTDATGTFPLGNLSSGVDISSSAAGTTVGGTAPGAGNLISGNGTLGLAGDGVLLNYVADTLVQGNRIGTDRTGARPLGNAYQGVNIINSFQNMVAGNVIGFNGGDGVLVAFGGTGNLISQNSIHQDGGLGINLQPVGEPPHTVTPNHPGGGTDGPNNLQNFPVLSDADTVGGSTVLEGFLNSTASTTFTLEFFSNAVLNPSGYGEGMHFLGSTSVTTDGTGNVFFSFTVSFMLPAGSFITATATDPGQNTSEFSQGIGLTFDVPLLGANRPYLVNQDGSQSPLALQSSKRDGDRHGYYRTTERLANADRGIIRMQTWGQFQAFSTEDARAASDLIFQDAARFSTFIHFRK